jgi:hypothetical protein
MEDANKKRKKAEIIGSSSLPSILAEVKVPPQTNMTKISFK